MPMLTQAFDRNHRDGVWRILASGDLDSAVLWERDALPGEDIGEYDWPPDMRARYLELCGVPEFSESRGGPFNFVELVAEEGGFDQPCRFGNRVEGHAVYCHNSGWEFAPRKCRRTWYTGGERRDEDCPGFQPRTPVLD